MSRTFTVFKDFYDNDVIIFNKSKMTINPGLTILVGCNGMGKTSLLMAIEEKLQKEKIPFISYNDLHDGKNNARQMALNRGEIGLLATLATSSEGEQIVTNLSTLARKIGCFVRENKNSKELWILLDTVDSGLSIDNIIDLKEKLFRVILNDMKDQDVYIICTANSYEMASGENCFDVFNGKYITFKNYEDYKAFILKTKEIKEKRYE